MMQNMSYRHKLTGLARRAELQQEEKEQEEEEEEEEPRREGPRVGEYELKGDCTELHLTLTFEEQQSYHPQMPVGEAEYVKLTAAARKYAKEMDEKAVEFFVGAYSTITAYRSAKLFVDGKEVTIRATASFQGRPWYDHVLVAADGQLCFARLHGLFRFEGNNAPQAFVHWYIGFAPSAGRTGSSIYAHPTSRCMSCACLDTSRSAYAIIPLEQIIRPVWLVKDLDVEGRYWAPSKGQEPLHQQRQ